MFEHFAFGATSRSEDASDEFCPLDTSASSTMPPSESKSPQCQLAAPSALNDLLSQLEGQDLRPCEDEAEKIESVRDHYLDEPPLEADDEEDEDEDACYEMPSIPPSIRCRRRQRQLNTQLLCSKSHIRSIDTLVDDMVATRRQCNVLPAQISLPAIIDPIVVVPATPLEVAPLPESSSATPALVADTDVDEGFFEPEGDEEFDLDFERELQRLRQGDGPLGIRKRTRPGSAATRPRIRRRHRVRETREA